MKDEVGLASASLPIFIQNFACALIDRQKTVLALRSSSCSASLVFTIPNQCILYLYMRVSRIAYPNVVCLQVALDPIDEVQAKRKGHLMDSDIDVPTALPAKQARRTERIKLYGPDAFEGMRRAGGLTAGCSDRVADLVQPGPPLADINTYVLDFAASHWATPATLG